MQAEPRNASRAEKCKCSGVRRKHLRCLAIRMELLKLERKEGRQTMDIKGALISSNEGSSTVEAATHHSELGPNFNIFCTLP